MPDIERYRIDIMSRTLGELLRRQAATEERLGRIEARLGMEPAAVPAAAPETQAAAPPVRLPVEDEPARPASPSVTPSRPVSATVTPSRPLETSMGLTWLNRAGVMTLVLGAAFFFKYAVDNGWIGESGRVALGVLAGLSALAVADRTWKRGHRIYAQGVCGAGTGILYLSFYAAFGFYHLLGNGVSFALMTAVTAAAGGLALRYGSQAILVLGLLGGYATPVLLSGREDHPWFFFSYVLLLTACGLAAGRRGRWRGQELLTLAAIAVLWSIWYSGQFGPEKRFVATFFALLYYGLFVSRNNRIAAAAAQVLAAVALALVWQRPHAAYPPLSLALVLTGLAAAALRRWNHLAPAAFLAFWILWTGWHPGPHAGISFVWLTAAFLIFLVWFLRRLPHAAALFLTALNPALYFALCYDLLARGYVDYRGLLTAAIAGVYLAAAYRLRNRDGLTLALLLGMSICFATLAIPIQFSGYRITMAWALEAGALVWIGARTGQPRAGLAGLAVFAAVLLRLQFLDAWIFPSASSYSLVWNARFLTFLTAVVSLWLSAWWTRTTGPRLGLYLAGHYATLWALILEALGVCGRLAPADMAASAGRTAVSILLAAYAVVLISTGVLSGRVLNRWLGLGLMALVVLKLYLSDVWMLSRTDRIWAFGVLGVLLLLVSFLYSRYRGSIEGWWRQPAVK